MNSLKKFQNNFEYIEINNDNASAKIALTGAHIFKYKQKNSDDLLWMSKENKFDIGKALRGGIPICWPAFGMNNPQLMQHGFARNSLFTLKHINEINRGKTELNLQLTHSEQSLLVWNYKFQLNVKITISNKLEVEIQTINLDTKEFILTQALHTYFNISNIFDVTISNLDKKIYYDALDAKIKVQNGDIKFTKEFDSVYQEINDKIILTDKNRTIEIKSDGSSSAVIWNPWSFKASNMSIMKESDYKEFVCIESANAFLDCKTLEPMKSHTLKATFTTF